MPKTDDEEGREKKKEKKIQLLTIGSYERIFGSTMIIIIFDGKFEYWNGNVSNEE